MDQCNAVVTYNNMDVKLHSAYYRYRNDDVALIYLDLSDRHCELDYTGCGNNPIIGIGKDDEHSMMEISFLDFNDDWYVFSCELCKYTIAVTLYKKAE